MAAVALVGPRGGRARLGAGLRARRDRLAHGRGRARRDHAPGRRAAAADHDRRGREPHERLDRAGALPLRGRRGGDRLVLARGRRVPKFVAQRASAALAVGLVAGRVIREVRARIDDPPTEITISILSGYAAYLPAEELGLSGVIAAVTVGLYMGWHTPQLTTPMMRLQGVAVWEILTFLLNAVLFLLVGLQLPSVLDDLSGHSAGELVGWGAARERAWWSSCGSSGCSRSRTVVRGDRPPASPPARGARRAPSGSSIGWAGMRGSVSLAAALADPAHDRRRAAVPGPRPDHLPRLRRDPRDARRARGSRSAR